MPTPAQLEALQKARDARAAKHAQPEVNFTMPNIPVVDSSVVDALLQKLADAEARANSAEKQVKKFYDVPTGMPAPQAAAPYVLDSDTTYPDLNQFNSSEVMAMADSQGKPQFKHSRITHRLANSYGPGQAQAFWLYDEGGYARRVQRGSLSSAFASGLYPVCPLCKGYHPESETDPNACPAKTKVQRIRCKICRQTGSTRYIYDTDAQSFVDDDDDDDDTLVGFTTPSTPEARLQVKLEEHIRVYHKATAASMKLN